MQYLFQMTVTYQDTGHLENIQVQPIPEMNHVGRLALKDALEACLAIKEQAVASPSSLREPRNFCLLNPLRISIWYSPTRWMENTKGWTPLCPS